MFEYKITFVDGSAWYLMTNEDVVDILDSAAHLPEYVDIETLCFVAQVTIAKSGLQTLQKLNTL